MPKKINKVIIVMMPYFDRPQCYCLNFASFDLYYLFVRKFRRFGRMRVHSMTIKSAIAYRLARSVGFIENNTGIDKK